MCHVDVENSYSWINLFLLAKTHFQTLKTGIKHVGLVRDIKELLRREHYKEAAESSKRLRALALEGLKYYQDCEQVFLKAAITTGFLGWIICLILHIVQQHTEIIKEVRKLTETAPRPIFHPNSVDLVFGLLAALGLIFLLLQSAPLMYFAYCLLPLLFWDHITKQAYIISAIWQYINMKNVHQRVALSLLFGVFSVEILVQSFFTREILSVGLLCFVFWLFSTNLVKRGTKTASFVGVLLSMSLAVFPILPVVGREANYSLVTLAGVLTLVLFLSILVLSSTASDDLKDEMTRSKRILVGQFLAISVSLYIVNSTAFNFPGFNQIGSWVILCLAFVLPLFSSSNLVIRLTSIALGFMSLFLLMSTAFEGLFLLVLSLLMASWLYCEHRISGKTWQALLETQLSRTQSKARQLSPWRPLTQGLKEPVGTQSLTLQDLRCAYFFVFFITVAFFGTGNIASINSFNRASVYSFLTVHSPFIIHGLLIFKVVIPSIVVTCAFDAVRIVLQVPVQSLFLVVLVITDVTALHFFYLVKDYGSWRQMGTSISHYVIMMVFMAFLVPIFGLARFLTGVSIPLTSNKFV